MRPRMYLGDEAMTGDCEGQRQPTGHQHARPVHGMEAQDVLAYDVVGWPAMLLQVVCCRLHPLRQQT